MNNSNTETFIQEDDNQTAISIKNLSKYYNKSMALSNVNLTLKKGSVMGLLGSNGSGKTTLLKILANVLKQDSGEVYIYGQTPSVYTKSVISFLPDRQFNGAVVMILTTRLWCKICGRPRGYLRKYKMCRLCFRKLASDYSDRKSVV